MISGASEQELELANARANIIMALDNTSTYESWLIIDTYIEKLEKENQQLKGNYKSIDKGMAYLMEQNNLYKSVIDEVRQELKIVKKHYKNMTTEEYNSETSVFVNEVCKKGFVLNVIGYLDFVDLILDKANNKEDRLGGDVDD